MGVSRRPAILTCKNETTTRGRVFPMYQEETIKMETREQCPKCRHHNNKFYVKTEGKLRLGHCKHCGYSMKERERGPIVTALTKQPHEDWALPATYSSSWSDWSAPAIRWVTKYGITQDECKQFTVGMFENNPRLWLPIFDNKGLASMQGRDFEGGPDSLKYITRNNRKATFTTGKGPVLVLVEDMLSAIKAGRHTSAMALCGTGMHDMHLAEILRLNPRQVLVCLDNDNSIVRSQQRKIKKTLDKYMQVDIVRLGRDLKEHTDLEIINMLETYSHEGQNRRDTTGRYEVSKEEPRVNSI